MASDARLAKLLAHIAACHSAVLPGRRLMLYVGPHHIGYVTPAFAARLVAVCPDAQTTPDRMVLPETALAQLNAIAAQAGTRHRAENFDVRAAEDGPVLAVLDRGALPDFGVIGVGVHLNGLVRRPDGWHLWVAKRAANKKLDPGKLDHLVAGGVPAGLSRLETLVKEGAEEASIPEALIRTAVPVLRVAYNLEREEGLRRDIVHAYDLILPENFTPRPNDDEVEHFELWPLPRVYETVATTDDFKFNVNLVLIDLFIRFGLVSGHDAEGLRKALKSTSFCEQNEAKKL